MDKKEKILCCIGNLTLSSTSKVLGIPKSYISMIWNKAGYEWQQEKKKYDRFGRKKN